MFDALSVFTVDVDGVEVESGKDPYLLSCTMPSGKDPYIIPSLVCPRFVSFHFTS